MNPGIVIGAALALGGVTASLLVQRRLEPRLASLPADEAAACDRAAKHSLVVALVTIAAMVIDTKVHSFLGPGLRPLVALVAVLWANATVLLVRRIRASRSIRALAFAAWCASIAMFGGALLFLFSGGRVT